MTKKLPNRSPKKAAKRPQANRATRRLLAAKTASGKRSLKSASKVARRPPRAKATKAGIELVASATSSTRSVAALAAPGVASALVVVEMSNNGPHDIRAITVDQVQVVENVATSSARSEFDISAHFNPPARIGWEIFAGIQFPRAGVFLERPGKPTQALGQQAPLKKGAPWLDEKLVN